MSRFKKASHVIWHCQYRIVWTPNYRFPGFERSSRHGSASLRDVVCLRLGCDVMELNVQADHVHLLAKVLPKVSVSELMGILKGCTAIRLFNEFPYLRMRLHWGNHFWSKRGCVDTVGLNAERIQTYVKYQERQEQHQQQLEFNRTSEPSKRAR